MTCVPSVSLLLACAVTAGGLTVSTLARADHRDTPINTASELRDWCKSESEAALIGPTHLDERPKALPSGARELTFPRERADNQPAVAISSP